MAGPRLQLDAEDVPQADRIERVVDLVLAVASLGATAAEALDFQIREYRYYVNAARILGFLQGDGEPTAVGEALAEYDDAQRLSRVALAFAESRVGRAWRRWAGAPSLAEVDPATAEEFLSDATDLAESTAQRRATSLRRWWETLSPVLGEGLRGTTASPVDKKLATPIDTLRLPVRTLNWAARNDVETLRDLVVWAPSDFQQQKGIGRGTTRRTRSVIEDALGEKWESATEYVLKSANEDEGKDGTTRSEIWHGLLEEVPAQHRNAPLSQVDLPARMRTYCEAMDIDTVSALLERPKHELLSAPNLGRTSISKAAEAIQDYVKEVTRGHHDATFFQAWERQLAKLDPVPRMVVSRRAGAVGRTETLKEIGSALGVSRERVRQIESKAVDHLQRQPGFTLSLQLQIAQAMAGDSSVPLERAAKMPYWAGVLEKPEVLRFALKRLLDGRFHVLELADRLLLAAFDVETLSDARRAVRAGVRRLALPAPFEAVQELGREAARTVGAATSTLLLDELEEELQLDEDRRVVAIGATKQAQVIALLRASPEPMPIQKIQEQLGRFHMPDEVLYFRRGVVGLRKHFPDFEHWQRLLAPKCVETMQSAPPTRQWMVPELLDEVAENVAIPEWFGHWHLANLLRASDEIRYLGRLRVTLAEGGDTVRLQLADVLEELLREAGKPLANRVIIERVHRLTDATHSSLKLALLRAPFVRVDDERFGLVGRDVPGGSEAVSNAVAAVTDQLSTTQRGMPPFRAHQLVGKLSPSHKEWSVELTTSVIRHDPRTRISHSGNIGLAEWEDVRFPSRSQYARQLAEANGGTLSIEEASQQIEEIFGARPSPPQLRFELEKIGFTIRDGLVARASPGTIPPPRARDLGQRIPGLPPVARALFEELLRDEPVPLDELSSQVSQYMRAFEAEHQTNEYADLALAEDLAEDAKLLLAAMRDMEPPERALAQAAIRYFVIIEDGDSDYDEDGLDDDAVVMAEVLRYLGVSSAGSTAL